MKQTIRKITGFLAVIAVVLMLIPLDAKAADTVLSISKSDIKAGDEFSVTVSGAASSNLSLHYDGTMVTLKSKGNASLDGNTLSINAKSATFTFTAKKAGSAGFVGSSDQYAKSSAIVNIAEASSAADNTDTAKKDSGSTESDKSTEKKTKEKEDSDQAAATSSDDTDTDEPTDTATSGTSTDEAENADQEDSAAQQEYPSFSASDLSLRDLVTDRRVLTIIGVLVVVIIILVIRLLWIHFSDYGDDDEDFSDDAIESADEEIPVRTGTQSAIKEKVNDIDDTELLYEKLKEEEKLTMPKTPVVPEKKLHLEDLNNL